MTSKSGHDSGEDETGRELRVKIILLVVALVLVAAYAAMLADLGSTARQFFADVVRFDGSIPSLAALSFLPVMGLAAALIGAGVVLARRRARHRLGRDPGQATDALARINGRATFMQCLATELDSHSKAGRQFALHVIDLDRFRAVNEGLGEPDGDAFLRNVAERLFVLVGHADRLARLGDDEFGVIQIEAGGARHAEIYARRIQDTLKDVCAQLPRHLRPGTSVGVAVAPDHGSDPVRLLHSASLALHAAKRSGGECFRVYARNMDMDAEVRVQMEKAIGNGLRDGWFELHYQPQYDLRSRRLTGFEALVRMNHPESGELQPGAFLPSAEESGLIQPLGEWIIRDALATAVHWPPHLTLSINISAAQFRHGDVAASILKGLADAGFSPSRLRIEISETVLLHSSDPVHDQLRRLKADGVTIVVDDFGLNSSSLQSLARSPCTAVKLDRSFVQHLGEGPETENLLRSLIGTAQSFDLDIAAEGVERAEQAHFLLSNDCRRVQGYLFGRPAHVGELGAIIAKDLRNMLAGEQPAASIDAAAPIEKQA